MADKASHISWVGDRVIVMYVDTIKITNLRCFAETEFLLQYPGRESGSLQPISNVNLILGDNGSGKTTVLKALALVALTPVIQKSGYVPYHMVRRQGKVRKAAITAKLILHGQDLNSSLSKRKKAIETYEESASLQIIRRGDFEELDPEATSHETWRAIYDDDSPAFLVLGYGASRRVESSEFDPGSMRKRRLVRYQRLAGLFEDHIAMTPLSVWLHKYPRESKRYKEIVRFVNSLLPEGTKLLNQMEGGEYLFKHRGMKVPFTALSDGYRAYIGWITDLLYHVSDCCPREMRLMDLRGIVMVDEVDLHLHPEWQLEVIDIISRNLPNLQFIFTSHSPIVAGTLNSQNIFYMELEDSGASQVRQYEEEIYGLNADQVLLSSYFNLKTTRAPGAVRELHELSRRASAGDSNAARKFLSKLSIEGRSSILTSSQGVLFPARKRDVKKAKKAGITIPRRK